MVWCVSVVCRSLSAMLLYCICRFLKDESEVFARVSSACVYT